MQLQLPKWMVMELSKDTDMSLQYYIKTILKEYINNKEMRDNIKKEEEKRKEEREGRV